MDRLALLVEADEDLAEIYAGAIQAAGYTTETVGDSRQALERLANADCRPELLLLDVPLTDVDSQLFLQQLRRRADTAVLRVLVIASDSRLAGELAPLAERALVKPVTFKQLRDLLSTSA